MKYWEYVKSIGAEKEELIGWGLLLISMCMVGLFLLVIGVIKG